MKSRKNALAKGRQLWCTFMWCVCLFSVVFLTHSLCLTTFSCWGQGGGGHTGGGRNNPGLVVKTPNPWRAMAAFGPDLSPEIWREKNPSVLFMAYPHWRGIFSAASTLAPLLGTYFNFSLPRRRSLINLLARTPSVRSVVVHGIPPGSLSLARELHSRLPYMNFYFVYHGTASAPFHPDESDLIDDLINATKTGAVTAVGNVKVGFSSMFTTFGSPSVFTVPNFPFVFPVLPSGKYSLVDGRVHIGLLVFSDGAHKNVGTQFVAACSIPNAVIHVTILPNLVYAPRCRAPVVISGILPHGRFLVELSRMDLVMYVSLTEAYPMVVVEAMSLGIPPVVSRTHHVLDGDKFLRETLVVDEPDNPEAVASRINAAIANLDELRVRLLALASCLRYEGELAWGNVLKLNGEESRRLQLDAYADTLLNTGLANANLSSPPLVCAMGKNQGSLMQLTPPPLFSQLPLTTESLKGTVGTRIAFITYELSPGNPGGAGVVISNLISMLLESGFKITVLAHTSESTLEVWSRWMIKEGWKVGNKEQLTIFHVPTLVDEKSLVSDKCHPRNMFLRRSRIFALAARKAYELDPYDALEIFEYAGAAFELLRSARQWEYGVPRGLNVPEPYLPSHIPILIRLHGSIQLISQAEGGVENSAESSNPKPCLDSDDEFAASPLMHLMERYALQTAHILLPQSRSMQNVYEKAYGLTSERMLVAPPPMERILDSVRKKPIPGTPAVVDNFRTESLAFLNSGGKPWDSMGLQELSSGGLRGSQRQNGKHTPFRLLVYGRVAKMKGAETVALSASIIQSLLPPALRLHLLFVGIDWLHPRHRIPTSEIVRSIVPKGFNGTVEFFGEISRDSLKDLSKVVHGGIFASEFETFGLAAHELSALEVPLIISNIPAFAEFFPPSSAYVFETGNATSLAYAALNLLKDLKGGAPKMPLLEYDDPISPYKSIAEFITKLKGANFPTSLSDTRLTEVSIARLEENCWPSLSCSYAWGRDDR